MSIKLAEKKFKNQFEIHTAPATERFSNFQMISRNHFVLKLERVKFSSCGFCGGEQGKKQNEEPNCSYFCHYCFEFNDQM